MNKFLFSLLLSLISFGIAGCSDEDDVEIIDLNLFGRAMGGCLANS